MGAALKRMVQNYNVQNRALKAIDRAKVNPQPAPKYPTEAAREARNRATSAADSAMLTQKIPELDERLKSVYVKSEGSNPEIKSSRKLPEDRSLVVDPEYGYLEPSVIPEGRIPLRLAIEMINSYKDDPETQSAKVLSDRYKLDLETTYLILEYFQPFKLKLPKRDGESDKLLLDDKKHNRWQKLLSDTRIRKS